MQLGLRSYSNVYSTKRTQFIGVRHILFSFWTTLVLRLMFCFFRITLFSISDPRRGHCDPFQGRPPLGSVSERLKWEVVVLKSIQTMGVLSCSICIQLGTSCEKYTCSIVNFSPRTHQFISVPIVLLRMCRTQVMHKYALSWGNPSDYNWTITMQCTVLCKWQITCIGQITGGDQIRNSERMHIG